MTLVCLVQYSTAKAAIIGFARSIAIEGRKYNILANAIAPSAGTAMTMTIWWGAAFYRLSPKHFADTCATRNRPQEMVDAFKPDYIAPIVGYLTSEANDETTGCLFEIMGGWAAQTSQH